MLGLWYSPLKNEQKKASEDTSRELKAAMNGKAKERLTQDFEGYLIRPDSIQMRSINGRPALSCIADYVLDGKSMAEYLIWIRSGDTFAEFFGRLPATDLDRYRESFDHIAETLQIP
jgi:hypothetical protein